MREVWRPRFFDRSPYEQWTREGRAGSVDLAGEFAAGQTIRVDAAGHSFTFEKADATVEPQAIEQ